MKTIELVNIDAHELARLRECEKAWQALFFALQEGNRDVFSGPGAGGSSGLQCAVQEVKRLQRVAAYARCTAINWERGDDTPMQA